jgi:fumarylpyruvate hydrolase
LTGRSIEWTPPRLPVSGDGAFPVRHIWCVGRNYAEHAREMGVDPAQSPPVFFSKPAQAALHAEAIPFPDETAELHHEVELVVALASGGRHLSPEACAAAIYGFAVGVDLTRRDVQARAKQAGQPWEMSKGFDASAPIGLIVRRDGWWPSPEAAIELRVNGRLEQSGRLGEMIRSIPELLADLSRTVTLNAGDLVMTGTPAGVGPLQPGDRVQGRIEGLPELVFSIRQA